MTEKELYVQESSEGDYLVIKPVPGQVVAQVDPGPDMHKYAKLFAMAPELLRAVDHVLGAATEEGHELSDKEICDAIDWEYLRGVYAQATI